MTLNLTMPDREELKPKITVFGVGGAGGNAVNNMIEKELVGVEFVPADTATKGGDQRTHLIRGKHLVESGLLYIQNLTPERQNGLRPPIPTLFGGTTGGVSLHQVQFGQ